MLTAVEARMQDYGVFVPADCVAAQTAARRKSAFAHMRTTHHVDVGPAGSVRIGAGLAAADRE